MNQGIKMTKQGFNVLDPSLSRSKKRNVGTPPHLLYAIALSYLLGSKKQVIRYQEAANTLKKRPILGVYDCLHEFSTLLEDLSAVGKYIEKCGTTNELHQLWFDVRNHIRHDIREEFDNESSSRKNDRAKRLKINTKLQTDIGFDKDSVKVGGVLVKISDINAYLEWADKIISDVLVDAKSKGCIK